MAFYCHKCNRAIEVDENFECPICHGGFVEEMPQQHESNDGSSVTDDSPGGRGGTVVIHRYHSDDQSPFINLFSNPTASSALPPLVRSLIFGTSNIQGPSTTTASTETTNRLQPQHPFSQFFNQLLANLADDGQGNNAHLTFTFGEDGAPPIFQRIHGTPGDYAWGDGGLDQIVTFLLNQFDQSAQHEALRADDINRLPMTNVTEAQVSNGAQCTTCMETFTEGEEVAKLNCEHIFHRPCIEPWLKRRNTCPICRKVIDPKEWEPTIMDVDELD